MVTPQNPQPFAGYKTPSTGAQDYFGAFLSSLMGTPDPQGRFDWMYAGGQPPAAAPAGPVPVAGAPSQIPLAVQQAPQGRQGRGRMPYKPNMAPSTGMPATPQQLNIPAQKPATAQSPGGGSGMFGSEWVNTLLGFLGDGMQAVQRPAQQPAQKTVPATSDAEQPAMSDAAYANQLGNRFLDLAGESNIRKAPDMMGNLYDRTLIQRQQQDALLADPRRNPQVQMVNNPAPTAEEYALRMEGRQPTQYGNPASMTQAQSTQASEQTKQGMAGGQQPIAQQQQFIADLAGIGQSLGVAPTDPIAMQAYLQRQGRVKAPTTGNYRPSRQY